MYWCLNFHVAALKLSASKVSQRDLSIKMMCYYNFYYLQRFNIAEEKRISQEIELQSYLNKLIIDEKKRYITC